IWQARALAARVISASGDDGGRIREAYRVLFGREPTTAERELGLTFLSEPSSGEDPHAPGAAAGGTAGAAATQDMSALTRWEQYAQVLLGSNEFTFVD